MAFDVEGALRAGYTLPEVVDYLGQQKKFDVTGARQAGYNDSELIQHLMGAPGAKGPQTGFFAGLKGGFESLKGDVAALGIPLGVAGAEAARKEYKEKAAQIYKQPELTEAPFEYVKGLAGQSLAYMGAPLAAGAAAAVAAPELAVAGIGSAALAAFGTSAAQFTGSNISRQIEEGIKPNDVNAMAAVGASIPQAALDTIGLKYIPGIQRIFKQAGRELTREEAAHIVRNGIIGTTVNTVKAYGPSTLKAMGTEGLTEAAQQVFERAQAGLQLTDAQARKEYFDNFIGGAILGGGISIPGRALERSVAREKYAAEDREAARKEAAYTAGKGEQLPLGQVPELGEGYEGFRAAPEPYREAEEKEGERQNRLFQITELRDQHDVLMREVDRLKGQFETAASDEQKTAILNRANELNTARADLEKQIKQLSKGLEGAERAGAAPEPGQMGLDFEAPAMPRQRTGEGVVLGETPAAPAGITPEQTEFFRQQRIQDIQSRLSAGQAITDADRAFLQMDEREQRASLAAQPAPELFTGGVEAGAPQTFALPEETTPSGFFQLEPSNVVQPQMETAAAPIEETRPVTEADFKAMGIGKTNKRLREAIMGKDLADPAQRAEVQEVLTDFANDPNRSPKLIEGVNNFLSSPVFMEQGELDLRPPRKPRAKKAKEATDVIQPTELVEPAAEPSTAMAGERGAAPPGGITAPLPGGVDVTGGAAQQPDVGAGVQSTALTVPSSATPTEQPAAPGVPFPVQPPTTQEIQAPTTAEAAGVPALAENRVSADNAISQLVFNGYTRKEAVDFVRNVADPYDNSVALEDLSNVIEGQFRVIDEETVAPAVLQLSSPEQQKLAEHYGEPVNSPAFLAKVREDIVKFATKGAQAIDKAIRSIIKKLHASVLAAAVILNPNYIGPGYQVAIPKNVTTVEQVLAQVPEAVKARMSPAAQQAYANIMPAIQADLQKNNKLFVLTDKPNARVFVFDANGQPILDKKVLLGLQTGDYYKGNTDVKANRLTPAGLFTMGLRDATRSKGEAVTAGDYDFGKVFVLDKAIDGEYSITLFHSVYTKMSDAQARQKALAKDSPEDSRYSFGCINVDKTTYKFLLDNYEKQMDGAKLFIVPDNQNAVMDFVRGKAIEAGDLTRQAAPEVTREVTKTVPGTPSAVAAKTQMAARKEEEGIAEETKRALYRTPENPIDEGMPKSAVQKVVNGIIARWKNAPKTEVVQDIQELPPQLLQQMLRDNALSAPGVYDPNTQTVYLIADNIPNVKEAVLTLTHEALGHFGIQSILGNTYGKVMDDIYNGNAKVREAAKAKIAEGLDKHTAVEEVLAEMAEAGVYNNAIQRIFNAIRQFIRRLGFNPSKVTDTEVRELLANAQRFVVSGGPKAEGVAAFKGKPLYRVGTDAFKKWFGNSVVRNPDGSPKLMYHGTARDIDEFRPKQANAIFVTDDPRFAGVFSDASENYMADELFTSLPEGEYKKLEAQADKIAKKEGTSPIDELNTLLRNRLPSRANIVPVYVSAQNPFDFSNPTHVENLAKQNGGLSSFMREEISRGSWETIEHERFQNAIRALGHDGFYVMEGGRKNLAVYNSSQLKSPFNTGAYGQKEGRILYRRRKEEPLTPEGQRAAALNDRMKGIGNEPEPDVDQTLLDRVTLLAGKTKGLPMAVRQAVVDKDAPVKEQIAAAYQNKVTDALGNIRPDILNEQAQEATGVADQLMRRGGVRVGKDGLVEVYDRIENGQQISLDRVFEIITEELGAKLGSANTAITLAHRAFIAQRANELNKRAELLRQQADAAEAKGNKRAAKLLRDQIVQVRASQEEIDAGLEAMREFPELKQAFDVFTKYNEGITDFLVAMGRLSSAEAQAWKDNIGYVPWTRIEEEDNKVDGLTKIRTGNVHLTSLPTLDKEGSSKEIRNVMDNMVGHSIWAMRSGLKNRAAIKTLEALPSADELKTQDEVDRELKNNRHLVVFAYRDGERVAFRLQNQEDLAAFSNVVDVAGPALKAFTTAATGLRSFVTHMPTFALSQLVQDTIRAMFLSGVKHPFSLPTQVLGNFYKAVTGSESDIQGLGITGAYDGMPDHIMRKVRERHGLQDRAAIGRFWDKLEDFSLAADMAVRAAIYDQTMKETGDRVLAFHRAKEYINFKTSGNGQTVRILRQIVPFMNAYIQGMDVLYRTIQGKGLAMEDRKAAMALFFGTGAKVAALSMLYAALVGDDDDYKGLDDRERDFNFIIPGTGMKLPVAPEIGFLFKVIPERIYQAIAREGTDRPVDATTFMKSMRNAAINAYGGVNLTPQLLKPAIEVATNYSFFTDNPIVGINMAGKETYLQFNDHTSELAKLFGYVGLSPMKVDYLMRGYLGTVGGVILDVTDAVGDPNRIAKPVNKLPLIKTFMYDDTGRGYKTEFYEFRERVDKVVNSVNTFKREGRTEELREYLTEDKLKLYSMRGAVNKIEDHLAKLRKYRNIIANDSDLSPAEKREKTDEILRVEKEFLEAYNIPRMKQIAGM